MMLCGCVVGQKGWTNASGAKDGRGGGKENVEGGTFWLKNIEGKKSRVGREEDGGVAGRVVTGH